METEIIRVIFTLIIMGAALYAIGLIPMDAAILSLIRLVVVIAAVWYVLKTLSLI